MVKKRLKRPEVLNDTDWTSRFIEAKRIGEQKERRSFPRLIKFLNDRNPQVRLAAVKALRLLEDERALEPLIEALADPDEWVRVHVVDTIGFLGAGKYLPLLSQFLENEEDPKVRAKILRVIGDNGGHEMVPIVALYLKDPNERVRANAVEALEAISLREKKKGVPEALDMIRPLVNDKSNRVRANTAKALWNLGEKEAFEIMRDMILSQDPYMRASAAYVLGETRAPAGIPYLIMALEDDCWFVAKNVIAALAKIGTPAIPHIIKKIKCTTSQGKVNAIAALGEIGDPIALEVVISMLNDPSGDVRAKAEEVLDMLRLEALDTEEK